MGLFDRFKKKETEKTPDGNTASFAELQDEILPAAEAEETAEAAPEAEVEPVKKNGKAWLWIIIGIIAAAAIFLLALMILGRVAPDLVDRFLYSEDELRIINY